MPPRYFVNSLADFRSGAQVQVPANTALQALKAALDFVFAGTSKRPFVYTGTAGLAYTCFHVHRHAAAVGQVIGEADLVEAAVQLSRSALKEAHLYPLHDHGWALLGGHAGVFCTAALCFNSALHYEERRGRLHLAAGLRQEMNECLKRYQEVGALALTATEDEFLYGRAGYLFGGLMLNKHIRSDAVPLGTLHEVVHAVLRSGRRMATGLGASGAPSTYPNPLMYMWPPGRDASPYLGAAHGLMGRRQAKEEPKRPPTHLYFHWHDKSYLGAAHGMIGILYVLLHFPDLLAAEPEARRDVEGALRYVLSLECDECGVRGQHGHYPSHMGPCRDREPLVHWCHGATGAVFLFCKAHQVLGQEAYLEAAGRSGEAVWGQGLLKKGPGACHGVSGSAYALLALHRATHNPMWLHRALQFALFMGSEEFVRGARTPDHPRSLFEGWAAACCLWADLLEPNIAGFPFFELDI